MELSDGNDEVPDLACRCARQSVCGSDAPAGSNCPMKKGMRTRHQRLPAPDHDSISEAASKQTSFVIHRYSAAIPGVAETEDRNKDDRKQDKSNSKAYVFAELICEFN
jgi:hypothetical protein